MNKQVDIKELPAETAAVSGLKLMRQPFPENAISKLPKPTKNQTEEVRKDFKKGIRCTICGGWHHKNVVHLDYVGHAALTDRLLDCDPEWNWEPVQSDDKGMPVLDSSGGMWIKLTVCGVTRLGYGDADGKTGGNAVKERIGDALRNAAMRFGAALDLWHKGELHSTEPEEPEPTGENTLISAEQFREIQSKADEAGVDLDVIAKDGGVETVHELPANNFEVVMRKLDKNIEKNRLSDIVTEDKIPY